MYGSAGMNVNRCYRFGPYRLDATDRLLYKGADLVSVPPKVFDTLLLFVTSSGRVLTKDELLRQLWPDTFVEDGTVAQYISLLRKALGENGHWVENLPRRGYRFTAEVEECPAVNSVHPPADAAEPVAPVATAQVAGRIQAGRAGPVPRLRTAAVTAGLVIAACLVAWLNFHRPEPIRSIAVLPFVNLSGDSRFDYIGDGLSDEVTHTLMQVKGLEVAARTSAFQFRGRNEDVRRIGQRLNVASVLEGSVRVNRTRIRVTAQLVDARSGHHVWADTFDGSLDDLFSIQQQIGSATAAKMGQAIGVRATAPEGEAFLPYLQGRYFLAKGRPETFRKAADSFRQVIAQDPSYARAHSGLADTYYRWALWESFPPAEAFAAARQAAERAIALDETLAEAHASLANIKFQYDWDYVTAERHFRRSIAIDPNRADTWHWFSHLLTAIGRFSESEEAIKKAIFLEPFDLPSQNHLGWCYYFTGDYDRSIEQHRRVLELDPVHGQTRLLLGRALLQRGLYREAIEQLRRNLELSPDSTERLAALAQAYAVSGAKRDARNILSRLLELARQRYVSAYSIATVYAALGDTPNALAYLEKAVGERSSRVVEIKYEPVFSGLHRESSFGSLLKRMGL
jgi:TolB-like protein/DNA-binding winged helix-turn-helix (wHTH) protein/Tfp pilus assembly protein PilF